MGTTAAETKTPQEEGTLQETPEEEETLQEVGTIGETKTPQEARTTVAETARTQQVMLLMRLLMRRKVRLEMSWQST